MGGSRAEAEGPKALAAIRTYAHHRGVVQDHVRGLVQDWREGRNQQPSLISYLDLAGIDDEADFGPLHHQVSMFLQASVETTASLISWTLLLLANNPQYWPRLHEESLITTSSSSGLTEDRPIHDAVINEALRLYPPAWMIPRVAIDEVEVGGIEVPRGARVVLSPWVTHRNPDVFSSPEEFRPERWLHPAERVERGGYFPFGLGTRICIGERYGKMTAKRLLSHITARGLSAEVNPPDLSEGHSALILNPDHGIEFLLVAGLSGSAGATEAESSRQGSYDKRF
jgi:cytochrome P450